MEGCSELGLRGASHATSTREFDQPSSDSICCRLLALSRSCLPQVDEAQKGILEQRRSRLQMFASGSMVSIVDDRQGSSGTPKALVRAVAEAEIAKVLVVGVGMRTHTGVARRMFGELAARGINISMINTSEVRVSVVVDRERGNEALACLKEAFTIA